MFASQADLVDAELQLVREKIQLALTVQQHLAADDNLTARGWPDDIVRAEQAIRECADRTLATGVDLRLAWLRTRLGLDAAEHRIVWVLLAHEMCPIARELLRRLNTETCPDPTTEAIKLAAFGFGYHADAHRLLAANSRLVTGGLIERTDHDASASDHRRTWKVARRLVSLAHGDLGLDPELARLVSSGVDRHGIGGHGIEGDPDALQAAIAALRARHEAGGRVLAVQGQRGTGRRSLLRIAAAECGLELLEVDAQRLARTLPELRVQATAIARECRLFDRVPLLRDLDALLPSSIATGEATTAPAHGDPDRLPLIIEALEGITLLVTTSKAIPSHVLGRAQVIEPKPITGEQRARLWLRALPEITADDANALATAYPITPALIDAASSAAKAQVHATGTLHARIRTGLRFAMEGRLSGVANRVDTTDDWSTLVLPSEQAHAIGELVARIRQRRTVFETWGLGSRTGRGMGVSALFSGPPGTGKTMAAGLIAEELGVDLYQVDTSKITSKWIGETEKNLGTVFDAAEAGHAILLFDEADALFGKRTEVRTSNDRHANQETNYLLQRLEAFRGVCILTTNHNTAIDLAFRRRLSLHVQFPMPDVAERALLWRSLIRDTIPVRGELDLAGLASRYEMSGGHIRNAVLRAAFFAADQKSPLTDRFLNHAAHLEYQAMGRLVPSTF